MAIKTLVSSHRHRRRGGCPDARGMRQRARRRSPAATPSAGPRTATWPPTAAPAARTAISTADHPGRHQRRSGARNVILLIGDGMGDSEITIARNYDKGAGGRFAGLDALPLTGQYTTYALNKDGKPELRHRLGRERDRPGPPGTKTYNGAISASTSRAQPQKTILELAKDAGLRHRRHHHRRRSRTPRRPRCSRTSASATATDPTEMAKDCPGEALENGRNGLDHRADARHPPRRHDRRRRQDLRADRDGRRLRGQDARGAGQGARLPDRPHRERIDQRRARPTRTQPVLGLFADRQHAGALERPRRRCGRATCSPPRRAPTTPSAAPRCPRWRT